MARLLAIEDSLTIRVVIEKGLSSLPIDIEMTETGQDGLDAARRLPPDLIMLDYVLPKSADGTEVLGIDVCRQLATDEALSRIPVIVMSAKADDVRSQFSDCRNVVACIAKPFSASDLRHLVNKHIPSLAQSVAGATRVAPVVATLPPSAPSERAGRIAMALHRALKDRLAQVPQFLAQMPVGTTGDAAALWVAKRLFDRLGCERVAVELAPVLAPATTAVASVSGLPPQTTHGDLGGSTAIMPLTDLVRQLSQTSATGSLALDPLVAPAGTPTVSQLVIHVRRGLIVGLSGTDPDAWLRGIGGDVRADDPQVATAVADQRTSGKPFLATLVERGMLAPEVYIRLTVRQGTRIILNAMQGGPWRFAWCDAAVVPSWCLEEPHCIRLEQVELERWRLIDDPSQVETQIDSLDAVFRRCARYSDQVRLFSLHDHERLVLTLVDGQRSVDAIIRGSRLPSITVTYILFRLAKVGLVVRAEQRDDHRPVILVADSASDPFIGDLQDRLAGFVEVRPLAAEGLPDDRIRFVLMADPFAHRPLLAAARERSVPVVAVGADQAECDDRIDLPFTIADIDRLLAGRPISARAPAGRRLGAHHG
jgi:two-component system phosphate regulon response regulator PhoB